MPYPSGGTYPGGGQFPGLVPGTLPLASIPSAESIGGFDNDAIIVFLEPILSGEIVEGITGFTPVPLAGIASLESVSTLTLDRNLDLESILSQEAFEILIGAADEIPVPVPISRGYRALSPAEKFSGVTVNQNEPSTDEEVLEDAVFYQEFLLPSDYERGKGTSEARIPSLTGFQVLSRVAVGHGDNTSLEWLLERYDIGDGWTTLASGTNIGTPHDGAKVWYTVYLDEPVAIEEEWLTDTYRIGFNGRPIDSDVVFKQEVDYENGIVTVESEAYHVRLTPGEPYDFEHNGVPSVLHYDDASGRVYYSEQRGPAAFYMTAPNPLAPSGSKAYESDGTTPLLSDGEEVSINFRVLSATAESGTDFLGNAYRSALTTTSVEDISTVTHESEHKYWLSKPNPSQFAVESMYFDLSDTQDNSRTVDTILLDPLTPGVYFSVYFSNEGDPVTTNDQWEDKLWTRVPALFQAKQRTSHVLPQPVAARYLKIEFTHLQPRWYAPGSFQKPILYKKHPKWVLDYFLLRLADDQNTEDSFIARELRVNFNAFDLAYNYYVDDLDEQALTPAQLGRADEEAILRFLSRRDDTSDLVDLDTMNRIKTQLNSYSRGLGQGGAFDYLLSSYPSTPAGLLSGERVLTPNQPIEVPATFDTNNRVSVLDRDELIYEKGASPMYFFVPCRHQYREVAATFDNDKGYFAGVKEVAFLRERYSKAYDSPLYIEAAGDTLNTERNDFEIHDGSWSVYTP